MHVQVVELEPNEREPEVAGDTQPASALPLVNLFVMLPMLAANHQQYTACSESCAATDQRHISRDQEQVSLTEQPANDIAASRPLRTNHCQASFWQ